MKHHWSRLKSLFVPISDNGQLFYFFANRCSLQAENYISGSLKKSNVSFPAHAALAMLQALKLLFHFLATVRTCLIAKSHAVTSRALTHRRLSCFNIQIYILYNIVGSCCMQCFKAGVDVVPHTILAE